MESSIDIIYRIEGTRSPVPVRNVEVASRWCAKEAAAKTHRRMFEPLQIEIRREAGCDGFIAMLLDGDPNQGEVRRGKLARWGDICMAAAIVPSCGTNAAHNACLKRPP